MAVETIPNQSAIKTAFGHPIYASDGSVLPFSSLFDNHHESSSPPDRILVIFIRHFFCGNCQEYVRRLSSIDSPFHPSHKSHSPANNKNFSKPASHPLPSVVIIGPGLPSLIATYIRITQCAFPVYCDPSTQLYDVLGMHRSLSLGHKAPVYIQHSLFSGAIKSAMQIVKRVGNGDATGGGDWNVNGGEFLFLQPRVDVTETKSRSPSRSAGGGPQSSTRTTASRAVSSSSSASTLGWEISWCHRMVNSRDHTELHQLHYNTCYTAASSDRTPSPPRSILVNGNRQAVPQRSQTFPNASTESVKSYPNDCHSACPAPDVPRSREYTTAHRSQSPAAARRAGSRSRSRSTSTGTNAVTSLLRPKSAASHGHDHHRNDSNTSASFQEVQPRKSFPESIVEKVGGLVRSKSHSKSSSHHETDSHSLMRRPSTGSQNHETHRPRMSLSLARSRFISRANTDPVLSTSIISAPIPTIPPPPPEPTSELDSFNNTNTHYKSHVLVHSVTPPPLRTRSRSRSRSQSGSKARTPSSRNENEAEMDENGIMVVDGVEFVNVISVQARVDVANRSRSRAASVHADAALLLQQQHLHQHQSQHEQKPVEPEKKTEREIERQQQQQQLDQFRQSRQPRNQGYTRGSVGLNLLTDRSTAVLAARLAATTTPQIGTSEALGIVGGHNQSPLHAHAHAKLHRPPQVMNHRQTLYSHHQQGGFESKMGLGVGVSAISSH